MKTTPAGTCAHKSRPKSDHDHDKVSMCRDWWPVRWLPTAVNPLIRAIAILLAQSNKSVFHTSSDGVGTPIRVTLDGVLNRSDCRHASHGTARQQWQQQM